MNPHRIPILRHLFHLRAVAYMASRVASTVGTSKASFTELQLVCRSWPGADGLMTARYGRDYVREVYGRLAWMRGAK